MIDKYIKYKTKYLELKNIDNQIGGNKNEYILLFPDIVSGNNTLPKKLINKITKKYNLININYKFENNFKLEDLLFENIIKSIYNKLDKNKKYIAIGLNQGCHICNYFSNKYKKIIKMQILVNNRRINEENYNKTIIRGYRMLEIKYNKDIAEKYKLGIQTNNDLKNKINEIEKYKDLIYHTIQLKIREQLWCICTRVLRQKIKIKDFYFLSNNIIKFLLNNILKHTYLINLFQILL